MDPLAMTTSPTPSKGVSRRRGRAVRVADELRRLMPRDRWLLSLLHEHHVLTTEQVAALAFTTVRKARSRLLVLHQRDVLDRFRHGVRPGSQSWRWTLAPLGAAIAAAAAGQPTPRPHVVRAATGRLATSPRLHHLLAVNQFFTALAAHARHHPDATLGRWWSERRATHATGGLVHPDGAGLWIEAEHRTPFWLEMDRGSEPVSQLAEKIHRYGRLAGTHLAWPVLFWLPTTSRENTLHTTLTHNQATARVAVATTAADRYGHTSPARDIWRVAGSSGPQRMRLRDIPTTPATVAAAPATVEASWRG